MTKNQKHTIDMTAGSFTLPLPLFERIDLTPIEKNGESFVTVVGLDQDLATQLTVRSCDKSDTALQSGTSDHKRFCKNSYEEWYKKGRIPFALVDGKGILAALIWFGPEPLPLDSLYKSAGEWDTIAFRSYEPYRGKGLMTPFGSFVLTFFDKHRSGRKLWLETNVDNSAGVRLYEKLGFVARGTRTGNGRFLMTREDSP